MRGRFCSLGPGGPHLTPARRRVAAPRVIPNDNIPMDLICPSHTGIRTQLFFHLSLVLLVTRPGLTDSFILFAQFKVNQLLELLEDKKNGVPFTN